MKTYTVYLGDVYAYNGSETNTVEYRLVPITFASLTAKIDGEVVETHKPLDGDYYMISHLQGRLLGNSWSDNTTEYYSSIDTAKTAIFENGGKNLTFLRKTDETVQTIEMTFTSGLK